jgi:putative tryptophan/tyrosine transport system substrate-binding protein
MTTQPLSPLTMLLSRHTRRRDVITLLGGAAAAWPLAAQAQQPPMPVIGFLNAASPDQFAHVVAAFRIGLNELGYVEGENVTIEYRWADGHYERLPALATDLVGRQAKVIATGSATSAALAVKAATSAILIVFMLGTDPVEVGLVASLSRPGVNLTGVTTLNVEIAPKRLEVLRELLPATNIMTVLVNYSGTVEADLRQVRSAAKTLGLETIHILEASTEGDLDKAFSTLVQRRAGGLVISADTFFSGQSAQLAALALRHAVPTVSPYREFVTSGGLMSYGASVTDLYRLVGVYVGRILKGEKPADLPVQQATKLELIINLKTAKTLGLDIPPTLLARADEVIE